MKKFITLEPGPEVIKRFSCSNQLNIKFKLLIESNILKKKHFSYLKRSYFVFVMLINVKMPTIVGILTLMSRIEFIQLS